VKQRGLVRIVDFNEVEHRHSTLAAQPDIECLAEAAEIAIRAIAQREYAVRKPRARG
jgi:hypothetical protein